MKKILYFSYWAWGTPLGHVLSLKNNDILFDITSLITNYNKNNKIISPKQKNNNSNNTKMAIF